MFSNKGYRLKLGGALVAIALLGVLSAQRGEPINPPLWRCIAEPARWNNRELWLPAARILSLRDGGFVIDDGDTRLAIVGASPARIGERVSLRGTFRADVPRLEMTQARVLPPDLPQRRSLMEVISVLVVLVVLANFARHFLFRPQVLQVKKDG